MTIDELKELVNQTKSNFDECVSVYEIGDELYGSFIEGYDKCRPTPCEIHGEKSFARLIPELNIIQQIEEGLKEHGLSDKYVKALDWEGTDIENANPEQRCRAAKRVVSPEENGSETDEA